MSTFQSIEGLGLRPSLRDIDPGARGLKWPIRAARRLLRKLVLPWIDEQSARNRAVAEILAEFRAEVDSHHRALVDLAVEASEVRKLIATLPDESTVRSIATSMAGEFEKASTHSRYRDLMIPYLHSLHVLERRVAELQGKQTFQVVPGSTAEAA